MQRVHYDQVDFDYEFASINGKPFTGVLFSEHSNGKPEVELNYLEGLPHGIQKEWYPNGVLKRLSLARRGNGSSRIEYWHDNGMKKSLRLNDENNDLISLREWDSTGKIVTEIGPSVD